MKKSQIKYILISLVVSIYSTLSLGQDFAVDGVEGYLSKIGSLKCPDDKDLIGRVTADAINQFPDYLEQIVDYVYDYCPQASDNVVQSVNYFFSESYEKVVAEFANKVRFKNAPIKSSAGIDLPNLVIENPNIISNN